MNKENVDPKLWELINSKDFAALNAEEKSFVLIYISEEEYSQWRQVYFASQQACKEEYATHNFKHNEIKLRLDKRFSQQHKSLASYSIPVWKAAAVWVGVFIVSGWFFMTSNDSVTAAPMLAKADTVYIQKPPLLLHDTTYITIEEHKQKEKSVSKVKTKTSELIHVELSNTNSVMHISAFTNAQPTGQSLSEDTISSKFFVSIM